MKLPAGRFIPKIQAFDHVESPAKSRAIRASCEVVLETLENVKVAFIMGEEGSRIASFHVEIWHFSPPLVIDVKLFGVF